MKRFLYTIIQIIWGLPQTFLGFIIFIITIKCPHKNFHGSICTSWKLKASLSLGLFIFVSDDPFYYYENQKSNYTHNEFFNMLAVHEYGHTIQSLIWGPLYLLMVGIPSMVWAKIPTFAKKRANENKSYFDIYPENQANKLGERVTGLKSPGKITDLAG